MKQLIKPSFQKPETAVDLFDIEDPDDHYCVAACIPRSRVKEYWDKYVEEEGCGTTGENWKQELADKIASAVSHLPDWYDRVTGPYDEKIFWQIEVVLETEGVGLEEEELTEILCLIEDPKKL